MGLVGQALIWASVIALWIIGSLFSNIPAHTTLSYGARGFGISYVGIFALDYLLMVGTVVALVSLLLLHRGAQEIEGSVPRVDLGTARQLAALGAAGFGLFAVGLAIWLGSFVPPGVHPSASADAYSSVMAPGIAILDGMLLIFGGLFSLVGVLGASWILAKVGSTYEESSLETGAVFSALPVLSIIGLSLALLGSDRGRRKLARGYSPPPPPPMPTVAMYPAGYVAGVAVPVPSRDASWDSLAAALIVLLVFTWVLLVPFSFFLAFSGNAYFGPGGSSPPASPATMSSASLVPLVPLFLGLIATAIIVPIAMARNKRKRQRSPAPPAPPMAPPPPAPPVLQAKKEDPLDHLV